MTQRIIYLLVLSLILLSCDRKGIQEGTTTYKVTNNLTKLDSDDEYLDGTLWDVVVYYYSGSTMSGQKDLDPIPPDGGQSKVISVDDQITKLKVSFKFLPPQSDFYYEDFNVRQYTSSFTFLSSGGHTNVILQDNTQVSTELKSTGISIEELIKDFGK